MTVSTASKILESENVEKGKPCTPFSGNQAQDFKIMKTLNSGRFSKILLARPEQGTSCFRQALVLKAFSKDTSKDIFLSEMELNYFLSPHPNIVTSYNVSFTWGNRLIFPMEYAPYGNLENFMAKQVELFPENQVKLVAQQLSLALGFMHGLNFVHRAVTLSNILVFQKDLSCVKLGDFGDSAPQRTLVTRGKTCIPEVYVPPEIFVLISQEKYHCYNSVDVWQLGILIFSLLTGGGSPWEFADGLKDPSFSQWNDWIKKRCCGKPPPFLMGFSLRFIRLLRRLLEPKPAKRCGIGEVCKYIKDDWITKPVAGVGRSPSFSQVTRSKSDVQAGKNAVILPTPKRAVSSVGKNLVQKGKSVGKRPTAPSSSQIIRCSFLT